MTKKRWIVLLSLGLMGLQAVAQLSVGDPAAQEAEAAKERLLKSSKISPRQKAALARADNAGNSQQASESFLAANKAKPGVQTLPSGVQYKVLKAGAGKRPGEDSTVRLRYLGSLVDGKSFDKADDKSPAGLRVAGLLPGLKEAVKLMQPDAKWEVVVPAALGYGAQGSHAVPPDAALIYVVELVGIN
jgi:FKBP-type peptidyl-prolyl cis-trans isomerase